MSPVRTAIVAAAWIVGVMLMGGCRTGIQVARETRTVAADDGTELVVHRLFEWRGEGSQRSPARGVLFYVQGSEPGSALRATESLAGACAMGLNAVMVERRGVSAEGEIDRAAFDAGATKPLRVADHLRVLDETLSRRSGEGPVIVVGASEGGEVAAAVAARESRITHLVLLSSGGGWTQEEEFREQARTGTGVFSGKPTAEALAALDAGIARIKADPDSMRQWLGLPHRRWSSFMFERAADDLRGVSVPILLVHGDADDSVPVGSARALRDRFAEWGKENLTYIELGGVDHRYTHLPSGRRALVLVELELVEWMRREGVLSDLEAGIFSRRARTNHPEWFGAGAEAATIRR